MKEYKEKIKGGGDSNTGIALFNIEKEFPCARFIVIDSDPKKAIDYSLKTYGINDNGAMLNMKSILDNIDGLHINIDKINDSLKMIWDYVSCKPFNKKRADMLIDLNVQILDPHSIDIPSLIKFTHAAV